MRSSMLFRNSTLEISARLLLPEVFVMVSVTFFTAIWPPKSMTMAPPASTVAVAADAARERRKGAGAGAETRFALPVSSSPPAPT